MAYNSIDQGIIKAFNKAGGRKAFLKKMVIGAKNKVSKVASNTLSGISAIKDKFNNNNK